MADDGGEQIYSGGSHLKSFVWKQFGFYKRGGKLDKTKAICKVCRTAVPYKSSTTNLKTHLKRKHGIDEEESAGSSTTSKNTHDDTSITQYFQSELPHNSPREKQITDAIARFIAQDLRPYSVVENEGFRALIHTLEPRYKIPSRGYFTDTCVPALYDKVKGEVEQELANAKRVAITTDAWTSRATNSYVTITAHHISPNWELKSHVLQTRVFNESHTGKNLGALLKEACAEWNIADKDPALVTDNAKNMVVAGKEADMSVHLGCFAHTINLASQKAFKVETAANLLGKVRKVVGFMHRNTTAAEILRVKQKDMLHVKVEKKLIHDVSTRWNSSLDMLERFIELEPAVTATLLSREVRKGEDVNKNTLKNTELMDAEDIVKLMAPVKVITKSMSEDEQPTLSMIAPYQTTLAKNFAASDDDTSLIAAMKKVFREDFEKRYTGVHDLIYTASALDPRFKMLPFLSDHEAERIFLRLMDEAAALDTEAVNSPDEHPVQSDPMETDPPQRDPGPAPGDPDISIVSPQIQDEPKDDDPPRKKKKSGALKQLFGGLFQVRATVRTSREKASEEVTRYKQRDPLDLDEDPLQWWKDQVDLPLLSSLAKKYLCIPGTSVASERVFSTAGDIVSAQRSVLSHEHIDQLVFLKKNLDKQK